MTRLVLAIVMVLLTCLAGQGASAHEIRPAYLQIDEAAPDTYDVIWRTPLLSGMRLPVVLVFPDGAREVGEAVVLSRPGSIVERRRIEIPGGLEGKRIAMAGLEATITDALVRMSFADGRQMTEIVRPSRPFIDVAASQGWRDVFRVYVVEGIRHILGGFDHLLFILGLMLLVRNGWMLVKTITAFTIAHSITLAAATYGLVNVPAAPLEAAIAASILFLGVEVARSRAGITGFAAERPWAVAFAFGLLHGIGFASGLSMIGLPPAAIPLALLSFNIGVEIGQLMFVAVVLAATRALHALSARGSSFVERAAAFLVGSLGAYWMFERASTMFTG